jgi:Activator of Hsp90 ATPase homolog 1-like protein
MPCTPRWPGENANEGAPDDQQRTWSPPHPGKPALSRWQRHRAYMEDRFDTEIDDLWSALTDPSRLARWLGEVEGDLRLGGEFRARFFASGWEGKGRVEACEPPERLPG